MYGAEEEWPASLDIGALIATGWRPASFREFILKIHSRCDLSCDYCYMYTMSDQSWRDQPVRMSPETVDDAVRRIAEHARDHGLPRVRVDLHGGEPLLAGPELITHIAHRLRSELPAGTQSMLCVQTNGMRLDPSNLRLLDRLDIHVGVSLDGGRADHDRHRRRANGQGSHAAVSAAVRRISEGRYRRLFRGLLCTIDLRGDPVRVYEELLAFSPPRIDFLLPHGNWSDPPPERVADTGATPYADWLISVFERWYGAPQREVGIRLFEEIIHLLFQESSVMEGVGLEPVSILVVETDGSVQQSDILKSAYAGAPETGLHVAHHRFDEALLLPAFAARQLGATALATTCRSCPVHRVCGGGLYAHRYRRGSGFANPSVYCRDLFQLITHIRARLVADVARIRNTCPTG